MKPWSVDVPVKLNVFIRPDKLKQVFSVVSEARPRILFLISDGPRKYLNSDEKLILLSRQVVEDIDWACEVHKLYYNDNQGMTKIGQMSRKYIFERVDRCIMLEDDVVPSISFFQFCAELLEKYKYDLRIHRICGMNHLGIYDNCNSDYFFSKEGSIWGYAIWKRTYDNFDYEFSYSQDAYIMKLLSKRAHKGKDMWKQYLRYSNGQAYKRMKAGPEFFYEAATNLHNQLNIVPTKNMISNIGVGKGSVHSADSLELLPKGISNLFFMKTYEYEFPLRHPKYVIEDHDYQNKVNKIMGWGHPFVQVYRKMEMGVRRMLYGQI